MQSMRRYYEDTMKRYMSDLQGRQRSPSPDPPPVPTTPSRREGQALDLTSSPPVVAPPGVPALDLSKDGGDEMPGSSEPFDRSDDDKSENNLDGRDDIQTCREYHRRMSLTTSQSIWSKYHVPCTHDIRTSLSRQR